MKKEKYNFRSINNKKQKVSSGIIALALVILFGIIVNAQQFLAYQNIMNVMRQTVTYALLSFGMAFVVISGSIDLSVATTVAMSGYICARLMNISLVLAITVTILFGVAVGSANAIFITKLKIPPMITTYCMQMLIKGVLLVATNGTTYKLETSSKFIDFLGYGNVFGIIPFGVMLLAIIYFVLNMGIENIPLIRNVYAIGGNEDAASMMGINIFKTRLTAHILCSVLACIAGINVMARIGAAAASAGDGYDMLAIASIVIGGIMMSGGRGKFSECLFGSLVVSTLTNIFKLQDTLNAYWEKAIIGIVLLIVLLAQALAVQGIFRNQIKK
ncbi:MAG: ABC transporter permease [Oliverpabstia sp.]